MAQVGPEAITKEAFELRYGLFIKSALGQLGLPDTEETRALLAQYRAPYLEALAEERALLLRAQREGLFPKAEEVEADIEAGVAIPGGEEAQEEREREEREREQRGQDER